MIEQYSAFEQWLINQELTTLDKEFDLSLDDISEYWNNIFNGVNINEREDFGISLYKEDSNNRFSIEINLMHVKTTDKDFLNELIEFKKQIKPHRTDYYFFNENFPDKFYNYFYRPENLVFEIFFYHKFLIKHYNRLIKNSFIDKISFHLLIRGPILYRPEEKNNKSTDYEYYDNDDEDEYFDESMTDFLSHPFCKLPRMRVSKEDKPLVAKTMTYDFNSSPQFLLNDINQELKSIVIVPGDKILFTINEEIIDLFKRWVSDRQSSDSITKQINQLYPSLTSLQFLTQLQEWTDLGKKIVKETELLNSQIQALTQNPSFDLQTVELLIKNAWLQDGLDVLTRDELLNLWVSFLRERGETRSPDYLKKNILRPRLKLVIDKVKHATEFDAVSFVISKDVTEKSGKPTTLFKYTNKDQSTI